MNCQEALDLLHEIIDKEASQIDARQVKEHLDKCHHCLEIYRLEESVQALLNEKVKSACCTSADKVEKLKGCILSRLDDIDRDRETKGQTDFFRSATRWLGAAAALVILGGGAYLGSMFLRHHNEYLPLEEAHWAAAEQMGSFRKAKQTEDAFSSIEQDYHYNIYDQVEDFRLVGAQPEKIMDTEMSHLVYSHGNDYVSVFVVPAAEFQIPADLKDYQVERNGLIFFDHNCRGCRLVYRVDGPLVFITATTDHNLDIFKFIPGKQAI